MFFIELLEKKLNLENFSGRTGIFWLKILVTKILLLKDKCALILVIILVIFSI